MGFIKHTSDDIGNNLQAFVNQGLHRLLEAYGNHENDSSDLPRQELFLLPVIDRLEKLTTEEQRRPDMRTLFL